MFMIDYENDFALLNFLFGNKNKSNTKEFKQFIYEDYFTSLLIENYETVVNI